MEEVKNKHHRLFTVTTSVNFFFALPFNKN
jgi:hypothetical protein